MAHSTPDRKPNQTASGYSFGLFHGYTIGHKVDYYWSVQKKSRWCWLAPAYVLSYLPVVLDVNNWYTCRCRVFEISLQGCIHNAVEHGRKTTHPGGNGTSLRLCWFRALSSVWIVHNACVIQNFTFDKQKGESTYSCQSSSKVIQCGVDTSVSFPNKPKLKLAQPLRF